MILLTNGSSSVTESPGVGLASGVAGGRHSNENSRHSVSSICLLLSLMLASSSDATPAARGSWVPSGPWEGGLLFLSSPRTESLPGLPWVKEMAAVPKTWSTDEQTPPWWLVVMGSLSLDPQSRGVSHLGPPCTRPKAKNLPSHPALPTVGCVTEV